MKKFAFTCGVLILTLTMSCKRENIQEKLSETPPQSINLCREIEPYFEALAKTIEFNLGNIEFRKFLKLKFEEQKTGDYDFLVKDELNSKVEDFTFSQMLESAYNHLQYGLHLGKFSDALKTILAEAPFIQISMPVNIEIWDLNYRPRVGYRTDCVTENESSIAGFDNSLYPILISRENEPEFPTIVISNSEAYDERGQLIPFISEKEIGLVQHLRISGSGEYIKSFNIPRLRDFEPWDQGKPEVTIKVVGGGGLITNSLFFKPKRNEVNGTSYFTINAFLFYWNVANLGNYISVNWIEYDGGSNTFSYTVTMPPDITNHIPGSSATITIKSDDDLMGSGLVQFTDPSSQKYTTGSVNWYQKNP